MKNRIILTAMILGLCSSAAINAQSVPASSEREVIALLKSHHSLCEDSSATVTVESVKISPKKSGFIGECKYGGGPSVLFERTAKGFSKLIAVDTGMNGYFYREKTLTKGYYDFSHSGRGGNEVVITTYKWNGTRYVAGRERTMRVP